MMMLVGTLEHYEPDYFDYCTFFSDFDLILSDFFSHY